ncbi:MAG: hypothetical protein M2R45_02475 [Verrucomicrobia subdivision 3 bacterium]|nr:hypothetical protein [Limisphaerales bacterium]MCS1413263.1 hypothetical protein [Limisphaerales bacterium]
MDSRFVSPVLKHFKCAHLHFVNYGIVFFPTFLADLKFVKPTVLEDPAFHAILRYRILIQCFDPPRSG